MILSFGRNLQHIQRHLARRSWAASQTIHTCPVMMKFPFLHEMTKMRMQTKVGPIQDYYRAAFARGEWEVPRTDEAEIWQMMGGDPVVEHANDSSPQKDDGTNVKNSAPS